MKLFLLALAAQMSFDGKFFKLIVKAPDSAKAKDLKAEYQAIFLKRQQDPALDELLAFRKAHPECDPDTEFKTK